MCSGVREGICCNFQRVKVGRSDFRGYVLEAEYDHQRKGKCWPYFILVNRSNNPQSSLANSPPSRSWHILPIRWSNWGWGSLKSQRYQRNQVEETLVLFLFLWESSLVLMSSCLGRKTRECQTSSAGFDKEGKVLFRCYKRDIWGVLGWSGKVGFVWEELQILIEWII